MEPALTNIGIVLPEPGYLDAVREITRRTGTLLIIDETHTICAGPGGATAAWGLDPDMLVIGKPIGGGVPVAAYGVSEEVGDQLDPGAARPRDRRRGVGGTLAGSALALSAIRATLSTPCARRTSSGDPARGALGRRRRRRHRAPPVCPGRSSSSAAGPSTGSARPPRTAPRGGGRSTTELEAFFHLWALNRGILLTPFHNMALFSPLHTQADVDRHTEVFAAAVDALIG